MPYQEIPIPTGASRNTWLECINDDGRIIGQYRIIDPVNPNLSQNFTASWQVEDDGTISGPFNLHDSIEGQVFRPTDINNSGVMAGSMDGWPAIALFENTSLQIKKLDASPRFYGADANALNDYPIDDARLTVVGRSFVDENGETEGRGFLLRRIESPSP